MNEADFKKLVGPINMLIGYAQSAEDAYHSDNIKEWGTRLVALANAAEKAWDEVVINISTVQEGESDK